jgi:hypothetical protein
MKKTEEEKFSDYLKNNTQIREDILNQKLIFDLKEACARNLFHLKVFKADVDINGFDIMLDDNDQMMIKCQLKSRIDSTTQSFDIHKIMLKPNHYIIEKLGFEVSLCPSDNRGVILIDGFIKDGNIITEYSYLDCFLLRAMYLGIFQLNKQSKQSAEKLIQKVNNGRLNEKIEVLQSLFFPVKNVQSLLSLMGYSDSMSISDRILKISEEKIKPQNIVDRNLTNLLWDEVNNELRKLINENKKITTNPFPNNF